MKVIWGFGEEADIVTSHELITRSLNMNVFASRLARAPSLVSLCET